MKEVVVSFTFLGFVMSYFAEKSLVDCSNVLLFVSHHMNTEFVCVSSDLRLVYRLRASTW